MANFLNAPFYNAEIKKVIMAFGALFSDIKIERRDGTGVLKQTIAVPFSYAPKEKWIVRIDQDPNLEKNVQTILPVMSFEILSFQYDATRKINRTQGVNAIKINGQQANYQYSPAPYNLQIALYLLTKTQEDALQVVEQILPFFTPEYTVKLQQGAGLESIDVPIVLDDVTVDDQYDGSFQERRSVIYTLNFTVKTNIFGPKKTSSLIKDVKVNYHNNPEILQDLSKATPEALLRESWIENF